MLGIICATDDEILLLKKEIRTERVDIIGKKEFITGELCGKRVVLTQCNIGKVSAAVTVTALALRFDADKIIFMGTAGSLNRECKLADLIVGTEFVQHDFYIPGRPDFYIPILGKSRIPGDKELSDALYNAAEEYTSERMLKDITEEARREFSITAPKVHRGVVASADMFVHSEDKKKEILSKDKDVLCTEMEGAAAAQAAYELDIPIAVIRVISDSADDDGAFSYDRFVSYASSVICVGMIKCFLEKYYA